MTEISKPLPDQAVRGVVLRYSPRVHGLTAGSCESGAIDCSPMANWGLETIVDDATFTGPVIMFSAGHGFGSAMLDTAQLMSSADVTINSRADYGHVDYMFSQNHLHELEHPIFNWLIQEPFK